MASPPADPSRPAVAPPDPAEVGAQVRAALAEDLGPGDATAQLLEDGPAEAVVVCKEAAVIAGRPWFDACFHALDPGVEAQVEPVGDRCVHHQRLGGVAHRGSLGLGVDHDVAGNLDFHVAVGLFRTQFVNNLQGQLGQIDLFLVQGLAGQASQFNQCVNKVSHALSGTPDTIEMFGQCGVESIAEVFLQNAGEAIDGA